MAVGCYYIISNPDIETRLRAELLAAIPQPHVPNAFAWQELEKIPYLKCCIYESLRLSYGVTGRETRTAPEEVLIYDGWEMPANTPISENLYVINHNEDYFPDSFTFNPDRWEGGKMDKYMFSFSRGTRQCLGLNLAQAELYKAMAMLFRRLKFELYQTDITDVEIKHDFFLPNPRLDTKGIRVRVVDAD